MLESDSINLWCQNCIPLLSWKRINNGYCQPEEKGRKGQLIFVQTEPFKISLYELSYFPQNTGHTSGSQHVGMLFMFCKCQIASSDLWVCKSKEAAIIRISCKPRVASILGENSFNKTAHYCQVLD